MVRILILDDEINIINSLKRTIQSDGYDIYPFNSPEEALDFLKGNECDIINSDMRMPSIDGAEFFARSVVLQPKSKRIAISGYADIEMVLRAINQGQIERFITKPWNNIAVKLCIEECVKSISLEREVNELNGKLAQANNKLTEVNNSLEAKVQERTAKLHLAINTIKHDYSSLIRVIYNIGNSCSFIDKDVSRHVGDLSKRLAIRLGLEKKQVEDCYIAGLIFQVGLVGVPLSILSKEFYNLTQQEKKTYLSHSDTAFECLSAAISLKKIAEILKHQHEKFKGRGTPDGLVGTDIPIGSRILAVARDFILTTNGKNQKDTLDTRKALQVVKLNSGILYDPEVLRELQKIIISGVDELPEDETKCFFVSQLKDGMILAKPVYNIHNIIIFPEGHTLDFDSIAKLRKIQTISGGEIKLSIKVGPSIDREAK